MLGSLSSSGAHAPRELDRVALHALGVRARARVLRLERARERDDGVVVRGVEKRALLTLDLDQVAQVARVEQELLLRLGGPRAPQRHAVRAAGETLDDAEELERAERLAHELVGARPVEIGALGAGQEHDGDVARLRVALQLRAVLDPVDARHEHVEHDHVRLARGDAARGHRGAVGLVELEIEDLERRPE